MSNKTIRYKLNTNVFPCINPGMYESELSMPVGEDEQLKDTDKNHKLWSKLVFDTACEFITDAVLESSNQISLSDFKWYHPKYYNYASDEIDFTVHIPESTVEEWFAVYQDNTDFLNFIKDNYNSSSGFISYMANDRGEFIEQCKDDPDRSIAQILLYNVKDQCLIKKDGDMSDMQEAFVYVVWDNMDNYDFELSDDESNDLREYK